MVLDPEGLAVRIDPGEGVAPEAIHVAVGPGRAPIRHQDRHLMSAFGRERPEVPLHLVVAHPGVGQSLLGVDEVLELGGITDEEHRRVVADQVAVSVFGVELERKSPRVTDRVGVAELAGDGGEAQEHRVCACRSRRESSPW